MLMVWNASKHINMVHTHWKLPLFNNFTQRRCAIICPMEVISQQGLLWTSQQLPKFAEIPSGHKVVLQKQGCTVRSGC